MNLKSKFSKFLFTALALVAFTIALAVPPEASAQVTNTAYGAFDNVPTIIEASSTSNVVSTAINVRNGKGLSIWPYFAGTNASTANVILKLSVTYDGTNYSTGTISLTNAMNGTTAVRGHHSLTADQLQGVKKLRLQTAQNVHDASVFITNVTWSISN